MRTTDTLRDEHEGVLTVLTQLDRAAAAAAAGHPMPANVFTDIQEFFTVFVDRCHHGKEETVLFPALGGAGTPLIARLEREHETGRGLARAYADAVAAYVAGDRGRGEALAEAARSYDVFLRSHIALENAELLPLTERTLNATQDASVDAGFEAIEEQRIGPGTHERLHQMIGTLDPRIDAAVTGASG
jgi:hemerythrin-like domain-containing protein